MWFLWQPVWSPHQRVLHITVVLRFLYPCMWRRPWLLLLTLTVFITIVSRRAMGQMWGQMSWTADVWPPVASLLLILFVHHVDRGRHFLQSVWRPERHRCFRWHSLWMPDWRVVGLWFIITIYKDNSVEYYLYYCQYSCLKWIQLWKSFDSHQYII